jgi:hypothetical protein
MDYNNKQKLFDHFLNDWGEKFNKIQFILNYISSYPELGSNLKDVHFLKSEDLEESQLEWISLIAQMNNPIDTIFFKPYWVSVAKNSYDYFIDLSSDTFSLFESCYFFIEPYQWYKKYLFEDITEFLVSVDNLSISIDDILEKNDLKRWTLIDDISNKRDKLGFSGRINIKPIDKRRLFCEKGEYSFKLINNTLEVSGINSIAIGLIQLEKEIILNHFVATYNKNKLDTTKIKNINALAFHIDNVGFLSIQYYHLSLKSEPDSYIEFQNNKLTIKSIDKTFLKKLIEKFELINKIIKE